LGARPGHRGGSRPRPIPLRPLLRRPRTSRPRDGTSRQLPANGPSTSPLRSGGFCTGKQLALLHLLLALLRALDALLEALLAALEPALAPLHPLLGPTGRREAEADLLQRLIDALERLRPVPGVLGTGGLQVLARALERLLGSLHVRVLLGADRARRQQADGDQDEQDLGHLAAPIIGSAEGPDPFERAGRPGYCSGDGDGDHER